MFVFGIAIWAALLGSSALGAAGQSYAWNLNNSGSWGLTGNWTPAGTPDRKDDVTFGSGSVTRSPIAIALGGDRVVNTLTFAGPASYLIGNGIASEDLTINGGGDNLVNNSATAQTINPDSLTLKQASTFTGTGSGPLKVNSVIQASKAITLRGNYQTEFTKNNSASMTGGINLRAGTLLLSADGAIGSSTAPVSFGGGTLALNGSGVTESAGALTLTADSTIRYEGGVSQLTFASATFTRGVLTISSWSGKIDGAVGPDSLFITAAPAGTYLNSIQFVDPYVDGVQRLGSFAGYVLANHQIIPNVPEPSTWFSLLGMAGLLAWKERGRLFRLLEPA